MKEFKLFDINIYHLKTGSHQYRFEIHDSFFHLFENSLVDEGDLLVDLELEKASTFITLRFAISGKVKLICDRSLRAFDHRLDTREDLILKFGDEEREVDEKVIFILAETQKINVAQWIYEFISVSLPLKKVHPDLENELDDVELGKIIYSSAPADENEEQKESEIDPRWNKLKNLKR